MIPVSRNEVLEEYSDIGNKKLLGENIWLKEIPKYFNGTNQKFNDAYLFLSESNLFEHFSIDSFFITNDMNYKGEVEPRIAMIIVDSQSNKYIHLLYNNGYVDNEIPNGTKTTQYFSLSKTNLSKIKQYASNIEESITKSLMDPLKRYYSFYQIDISGLTKKEIELIKNSEIAIGMSKKALILSKGLPDKKNITQTSLFRTEQWIYGGWYDPMDGRRRAIYLYVYFENDYVTVWQN